MAKTNPDNRDVEQEILEELYAYDMTHGKTIKFCQEFMELPRNQVDSVFIDFLIENNLPGSTATSFIASMAQVKAENFLRANLNTGEDFDSKEIQTELRNEIKMKRIDLLEQYIKATAGSEEFDKQVEAFNQKALDTIEE